MTAGRERMKSGRVSGTRAAPRPARDATSSHGRNEAERRWQLSGRREDEEEEEGGREGGREAASRVRSGSDAE